MKTKIFFFLILLVSLPSIMSAQKARVADADEQKSILWRHNHWRRLAKPDMVELKWSRTLAMAAKLWAEQLGHTCEMKHGKGKYGENLFWATAGYSASAVVDYWAEERHDYDYDNNTCSTGKACGHYTQIVWEKTTKVGCAKVRCQNGNEIWVCMYDPAGNIIGAKPYHTK